METIVDLGCGIKKVEGAIGIDRVGPPATQADIVCNLGFEKIPLEDNSVDTVSANSVLEHIPMVIWDTNGDRVMPMVQLFNEIYRILKPGGQLRAHVPYVGSMGTRTTIQPVIFAGLEHVSFWAWQTVKMFCDGYYNYKDVYGHTSNFKLVSRHAGDEYMHFILEAIK